ncbi:MAG: hypothetical protein KBD76_13960 [Bacteriovorax sp.]|nr:hypothetical protein [Bacteriovorax sp.]
MKVLIIIFIILLLPQISFAGATSEVLKDSAKGAVVGGLASKAGQKIVGEKISQGIGKFFDSPPGIFTVSGIATVYTATLYNAAAEQEEESKGNIAKIERIMAEFKDSYFTYCPNGRENLSEPQCYCYLDNGNENPNRTKSQSCQDLWAKNKRMLSAKAGDYSGVSKAVDPVGCVNINGQFDENCTCTKFLDKKTGSNSCQKTVSVNIPSGFSAAMINGTGLKDVMQMAANSGNGNPMFNNFNNNVLGSKAIATGNLQNQLLKKLASVIGPNKGPLPTLNESNVNQYVKGLIGEKAFSQITSNASPMGLASSGFSDPKTEEVLKSAAAKAGLDMVGSGRGLQNKKAENKEGMNFNLATENASTAGQVQSFPEMEKNYNYKDSDISKNSDSNLFDIISNRYIQSGLKRLFDN